MGLLLGAVPPFARAADAPVPRPAADEEPPRIPVDPAWRDASALERRFAEAVEFVEKATGMSFAKRPSVRVSSVDELQELYQRERLAAMSAGGLAPMAWAIGSAPWLMHHDPAANVVHAVPDNVERAGASPGRRVLATEAGLRLLLVEALVGALHRERLAGPHELGMGPWSDEDEARIVVRWAHRYHVMAAAAEAWGIAGPLRELQATRSGADPDFALVAGVPFLEAVRAERGGAGLAAALRDPPTSTREIERPELWLNPTKEDSGVDLGRLLQPMRQLLQDPLWHVRVTRPADQRFRRSLQRLLGRRATWTSPATSLDGLLLQAADLPNDAFGRGSRVIAWVVLYPDADSARRVVEAWVAAGDEREDPDVRRSKGAGPGSKLLGTVIEYEGSGELPVVQQQTAIGRVVVLLTSVAAPEIDRAALDMALDRMAAYLEDPERALAAWAVAPIPPIPHARECSLEVKGPEGTSVHRATVLLRLPGRGWDRVDLRDGKATFRLPAGVGAALFVRAPLAADGSALPFAPVEREVSPSESLVQVTLSPGTTLEGVVEDYDEVPIPGVLVVAVPQGAPRARTLAEADVIAYGRARSGPDGRYRIVGLGEDAYSLLAFDSDKADAVPVAKSDYAWAKYGSHVQVARGKGQVLTFVDVSGRPVRGVRVVVRKWDIPPDNPYGIVAEGTTDAEGRVRIMAPTREFHRLIVDPPEGADLDDPDVEAHRWYPKTARLVLREGRAATGTVRDATGRPILATVFRALGDDVQRVRTDVGGSFRIRGLGTSSVRLLAVKGNSAEEPPADAPPDAWVEVPHGARTGLELRAWVSPTEVEEDESEDEPPSSEPTPAK